MPASPEYSDEPLAISAISSCDLIVQSKIDASCQCCKAATLAVALKVVQARQDRLPKCQSKKNEQLGNLC